VNQRGHERIAAAAKTLAGKAHSQEELEEALFLLVNECYLPEARPVVPVRRVPLAGEILPPQQRATWARGKTIYDDPDASIPRCLP
jgi:hypothetical protein